MSLALLPWLDGLVSSVLASVSMGFSASGLGLLDSLLVGFSADAAFLTALKAEPVVLEEVGELNEIEVLGGEGRG